MPISSLSHAHVLLINSPFTFHYQAYNSPSLFTYHIRDDFYSADPSSLQYKPSHMNSVQKTLLSMRCRSSVDRVPPGVQVVMGWIPVGDSDFSFVLRPHYVDLFTFHISLLSLKSSFLFTYHRPDNVSESLIDLAGSYFVRTTWHW